MKAFKRYSTALKHANGNPTVRVGELYIVGGFTRLTEVSVLDGDGKYGGYIILGHLDRLGNGNHAKTVTPIKNNVFEQFVQ